MTPAANPTPAPPFTQCPAIGDDTSCAVLIVINPDGSLVVLFDPSQGPYDGSDDTLVGVQNNSPFFVQSINLSSSTGVEIFGFEEDGICDPPNVDTGCATGGTTDFAGNPAYGPFGYEGPNTSFSNIDGTFDSAGNANGDGTYASGTVNFLGSNNVATTCGAGTTGTVTGLAPGASAYFALEEALDSTSGVGSSAPPTATACPPPVVQATSATPAVTATTTTGPALARTGINSAAMAEVALLLIMGGGLLLLASRKVRPAYKH